MSEEIEDGKPEASDVDEGVAVPRRRRDRDGEGEADAQATRRRMLLVIPLVAAAAGIVNPARGPARGGGRDRDLAG